MALRLTKLGTLRFADLDFLPATTEPVLAPRPLVDVLASFAMLDEATQEYARETFDLYHDYLVPLRAARG